MKTLIHLAVAVGFLGAPVFAAVSEGSKRIEKAVDGMSNLAQSGVSEYKVKPSNSVKKMLLELAIQAKYVEDESEFDWTGTSGDAWEGDSMKWGETDMKGAYSYIFDIDEQYEDYLNEPGNEKEKAKYLADTAEGKKAFKLLLNSGVKFGIAPLGAIQCGFTFSALTIMDPATGKIFLFRKEGSGC